MGLRGRQKKSKNQEKTVKLPYFIPVATKEQIVDIAKVEDKYVTDALVDLIKEEYESYFGNEGGTAAHDRE